MLLIDTSAETGVVALSPTQFRLLEGRQSVHLVAEIKNLLNGQVPEAIAVGVGPGSLIGTRVGVVIAKTLASAWNIPCIPFCSLAGYPGEGTLLRNAKSRGYYTLKEGEPALIQKSPEGPIINADGPPDLETLYAHISALPAAANAQPIYM